MPRASIDIGSNTLLLLVLDDSGATLHDEPRIVGLGRGLGDRGLFRPDRMEEALAALRDLAATARSLGVLPQDIVAVATSAARRALNAETFFARVQEETGLQVRIISGHQEASLTWHGALVGLPVHEGPLAVVDLGAGSTEVVVGEGATIGMELSLELGGVRLTERFFGGADGRTRPADLARLRSHVDHVVEAVTWPVLPRAMVAVAGTATTLAAIELGLQQWDRDKIHGMRLTRGALRRIIDRLLPAGPHERREIAAISPERADYLLAGACVLESICTAGRRDSLWVSDGGVRHGALIAASWR